MENTSPGKKSRVKRCLFGRPDQHEVEKWLAETSEKQLRESREKWSYDFELDVPVSGDVEYEAVPVNRVPSLYKSCTIQGKKTRRVAEFDPNIPSASLEEEKFVQETNHHRPLTRSCTKQHGNHLQNQRSLKQAKLTSESILRYLASLFGPSLCFHLRFSSSCFLLPLCTNVSI
ncbi:Cyclin-dependent kinase inhibitor [Ancylostoma caninum]|uniref:Cyclin-dependent kinase inhibitor n=1 Tax=Ancylostoma caninum TaxID=29170 RepID=A0A368GRI7_ANCCA|nr:Cyclin-dependent kinase inhibitor [Ancylostoma caninum]